MKILKGKVKTGKGKASGRLKNVKKLIEDRIGLINLIDGTLNVYLDEHYPITAIDGVITDREYNHEKECIKLKRCKVNGLKCIIVRPSQHEDPEKLDYWMRIELMSNYKLKDKLQLNDEDEVTVEANGNDEWWEAKS